MSTDAVSALQATFVPSPLVGAGGSFALWGVDDPAAVAGELDLPTGEAGTLRSVDLTDEDVPELDRDARLVPILPVVRRLAAMPPGSDWPAWRRPSDSLLAWSLAAKLGLELVAGGHLVPMFRAGEQPDHGFAEWRVTPGSDKRVARLATAMPVAAHALRRDDGRVWEAHELVLAFLDGVADACAREGRRPEIDPRRRGPKRPWSEMWSAALTSSDPTVEHLRLPADEISEQVAEWASPVVGEDRRGLARLAVRLDPPEVGDDGTDRLESRLASVEGPWELQLLLQSVIDDDMVTADEVWDRGARGIELGGRRVEDPQGVLIRGLTEAARLFEPLERCLSQSRPTSLQLRSAEVAELLEEGRDALGDAGVTVLVPPELRDAHSRRLRARVRIGEGTPVEGRALRDGAFNLQDLTDFRFELAIGDDTITAEELDEIVSLKQPLVRWRGQWVRVDQEEAEKIRGLAGEQGTMQFTEALAAALSGQQETDELGWVETETTDDIGVLLDQLREAGRPEEAEIVGIEGQLRDYQVRGVAWLQHLTDLGMGGVLADDMGLGKTLEAIALITSRPDDRPSLVVCPTSVVGNWIREINRFAPDLPVVRYHGPDRPEDVEAFEPGSVVMTSYALLRRDVWLLEQADWDIVVFDEAQQIKNPASKGAKAARAMDARARIAMTGTPIENRLSELWSIVDVTNPGLLGSQKAFNDRFAVPIERWHDEAAASRLKRLIAPFVLRRRKSDPEVSIDLPPKQEVTTACSLTREQAALYQAAVEDAFTEGLGASAFERRGRILALLTALKQICNHPAHYLGESDDGRLPGRSGKLARATEILGEVVASGDHALVFTQYRVMGDLLVRHFEEVLDLPEVPFLHGGVPAGRRDDMVDRFQDAPDAPPLLLVSLRAGGTGLNLTRATEVLHYDRWWNPAVEDQATDRAHRLGQNRPVTVHKLVTSGTVEDRIAETLERKKHLADSVVGEGEAWITELNDDELMELVSLSTEDVEEEVDEDEDLDDLPGLELVGSQFGGEG